MVNDLGQPIGEPIPNWQPRPSPSGTVLSGRYCRLEPLVSRHVPSLHDALNVRSIAAARRLGFIYEGTWRNATIYKGRNRDTAWFAMTDADWSVRERVISAWLDPDNFDPSGQQRSALSALTSRCGKENSRLRSESRSNAPLGGPRGSSAPGHGRCW